MAYRRFVSYIYEYPGGKKGENCGFVRVEIRNGICQMGFWLKACGFREESSLRIFGLVREQKKLVGVPIGELGAGPSGAAGRVSFQEQEIGNSPYGVDQLVGLLLISERGRKFATQWGDEPLPLAFFEEWKKNPDSRQKEMPDPEERESDIPEPPKDYDPPADIEKKGSEEETDQKEPERETKGDCVYSESSEKTVPMAAEMPVCQPEICQDTAEKETAESSARGEKGKTSWAMIQEKCVHFHPFPDDSMTECVRIGRQEMAALKRMGWMIERNPFMNHGLNSYSHLLLGRDAEKPGVYYLGVPGVFNTNEQFMAGMFGFSQFRAANPPAEGKVPGSYGYWCRRIYSV